MLKKIIFYSLLILLFTAGVYSVEISDFTNDFKGFVASENVYDEQDAFVLYAISTVVNKKGQLVHRSFWEKKYNDLEITSKEIIKKYIKNTKNINQRRFGLTMFNIAVLKNDRYSTQLLLEAGASPYKKIDVRAVDSLSKSMREVIIDGLIEDFKMFLDKADLGFMAYSRRERKTVYTKTVEMSFPEFKGNILSMPFVTLVNVSAIKDIINEMKQKELKMIQAAKATDINNIAVQIEKKADVNFTDENGDNIIQILIKQPELPYRLSYITRKAIDAGLNVMQKNNDNVSLFYMGYKKRTEPAFIDVWELISKAAAGNPESLIAAIYMDGKVLEDLLNKGLNQYVDYKSEEGTPLTVAVRLNKSNVVRLLLKNGADPNVPDLNGDTPLYISLINNFSGVTKLLINAGASKSNKKGDSSVIIAAKRGNMTTLKQLVNSGADINVSPVELVKLVMKEEDGVVGFLVDKGLQLPTQNINDYLLQSVKDEKEKNAESFIKLGADINMKTEDGKALIDFAKSQKMKDFLNKNGLSTKAFFGLF